MKRTTHTSRWLVTALVILLGAVAGPTAAWADERPGPAFGIAALGEVTELPAPVYGVNQGLGAATASVLAITDARHAGLVSRPAPAHRLAAREPSVVDLPRYQTALPRPAPEVVAAPVVPTAETGFDWLAVGIGIVIGFGVAALVALALVTVRRRGTLQGA